MMLIVSKLRLVNNFRGKRPLHKATWQQKIIKIHFTRKTGLWQPPPTPLPPPTHTPLIRRTSLKVINDLTYKESFFYHAAQ